MESYTKTSCNLNQTSKAVWDILNENRQSGQPLKLEIDLCRLCKETVAVLMNGQSIIKKRLSNYYSYASNTLAFADSVKSTKPHDDFPQIIVDDLKNRGKLYDSLLSDRVDFIGVWTEFPSDDTCFYSVIAYNTYNFDSSIKSIIDGVKGNCTKDNILSIINSILKIIHHKPLQFNDDLKRYITNEASAIHDDKQNMAKVVEKFNSYFEEKGNFVIMPINSTDAKEFIQDAIQNPIFNSFIVSDIDQIAFDSVTDSDGQIYYLFASKYVKINVPVDPKSAPQNESPSQIIETILKPINAFRSSLKIQPLPENGLDFVEKKIAKYHLRSQNDLDKLASKYGEQFYAHMVTEDSVEKAQQSISNDAMEKGLNFVKSATQYAIHINHRAASCTIVLILYNAIYEKGENKKPKEEKRDQKRPAREDKPKKPKREEKKPAKAERVDDSNLEERIFDLLNAKLAEMNLQPVKRSEELEETARKIAEDRAKDQLIVIGTKHTNPIKEKYQTLFPIMENISLFSATKDTDFVNKIVESGKLSSNFTMVGIAKMVSYGSRIFVVAVLAN